ncbi:MAG: hypothetical protein JRC77_11745, partial [Deltaproteobacteria bacterium]|nr:hypothetical protein [Deltaproteobacteria bacterium]
MDRSDLDHDYEEESTDLPAFLMDPKGVLRRRWRYMAVAAALAFIATVVVVSRQRAMYSAAATVLIKRQRIPENLVRSTVQEDSFQVINALLGEVLSQLARRQEGARIIAITFDHTDRFVAASTANVLARALTDESLRSRSEQARVTTDFLRRELERSETVLEEQSHAISEYQQAHHGELPSEEEANLRHLQRLQEQRQSLALQITEAESRLASITISIREGRNLSPSEERLEELRDKLAEAEGLYTDEHPTVLSTRRQIKALEAIIAERQSNGLGITTNSLVAATQNEIRTLRDQASEVEKEIIDLDERVARTPVRREELSKLEQTASVLNENYLEALRKVQEAELAQNLESAQQGSRLSLLDEARPPSRANGKRLKYAIAGFIGSLGLAILVGCILELL